MLGLGANISGGSPVGIVGAAAPTPPSDYVYESDFTTDIFENTYIDSSVVDHEGRSDVNRYFNNVAPGFFSKNTAVPLGAGSYEIDFWYYVPSGSNFEKLSVYRNLGSTEILLASEVQYDQWVNLTHNFNINQATSLFFIGRNSDLSSGDCIFLSDVKISLNIAFSPSPPPGGYYDGALDQSSFSYVGAAAAYSLRLVYSYYDGSAIRVRRASDNTEQDIGFSNGVLDTSTLSTFCSGTDGFIKVWYDQSLNGWGLVQAATANQPKIYDSVDGVVINPDTARPSTYFAAGNFMETANYQVIRTKDYAQFQVHKLADASASNTTRFTDNDLSRLGNQYDQFYFFDGTQGGLGAEDENTNLFTYNRKESDNLITWHKNGALAFTRDSYLSANWPVANAGPYDRFQLGTSGNVKSFYFDELVIYNSDQSTNRTGIEANINDFYNIYTP